MNCVAFQMGNDSSTMPGHKFDFPTTLDAFGYNFNQGGYNFLILASMQGGHIPAKGYRGSAPMQEY